MPNKLLSSLVASCAVLALSVSSAIAGGTAVAHAAASASAYTPRYVFTDLGVLPPGLDSQARALSDRGKVVGLADTCPNCGPAGFHAFLWTPARPGGTSGSMTGLGTLRGQAKSLATGINNAGRVVGTSFYPTPDKAFIYNGSLHSLGRLHRGSSTEADGINSAGAVVGASGTANGFDHAFLWVPNKREGIRGRMHDLGTPPGKAISTASAINDKGMIAGSSLNAEFSAGRAFVWRPSRPHGTTGTMTNLPQPRGVTGSGAAAINDHGLIVGTLITAGGQTHAFVFRARMHDLGTLPGGTESFAHGINNHGVIVGYSTTANGTFRAVMWAYGKIINLNRILPRRAKAAGVVLGIAYAINDKGQIAGVATVNGHGHGFLLAPAR